jgi:hypothetical protein
MINKNPNSRNNMPIIKGIVPNLDMKIPKPKAKKPNIIAVNLPSMTKINSMVLNKKVNGQIIQLIFFAPHTLFLVNSLFYP